jgi:RHS repeat-associated protein
LVGRLLYDEQGRKSQLHTWKVAPPLNPSAVPATPPAGSEITQWIYGPTTGHLTRKQYADAKGTNYTYTPAGRLKTRTWQRGVTTTYSYTQGLLTLIDYSDATPDVSITYDALGRQASVTQTNQSKISYTYDPTNLSLDLETIQYDIDRNGSYEFTRVLDRSRDTLQRDIGFQLKNGTTLENQAIYTYGPTDGRMASIRSGDTPVPTNTFSYQYLPNSNLIQKVAGPAHDVINTYEPTRDILDTKTNQLVSTVISRYDYAVNEIGQRTGLTTSGTAFPNLPSWFWGYDSLGQVTSADSSITSNDRSYQYDSIGNRKKSADSLTLPMSDNYMTNALNQYTSRSVGVSPVLHSSYDNDGNAIVYPLPVTPTNNNCTLTWDAENRLISSTVGSVTNTVGNLTSTVGNLITTYAYDAQSRRIATISRTVVKIPFAPPPIKTTYYLYDDWNCIAEYSGIVGVPPTLQKTRLWGLDLSGTLQGAGGVGGLLAESSLITSNPITFNTSYPTYDGNGNVSEYLNSTGQVTAHFEYDPFGNTVVNTDTTNKFGYRFSTKPLDADTGLYYYGYRYYDPVTGRWPSRDPIAEKGGFNLYGFVGNDGVNKLDILGLTNDLDRGPCKYSDGQCPNEWPVARNMRGTRTDEGKWEYSHSEPASMNDLAGLISNNFSWYSGVLNFGIIVNVYTKTEKWKCTYDCVCKGWGEATIAPATGSHTMDVPKTKRRYGLGNTSPGSGGGGV